MVEPELLVAVVVVIVGGAMSAYNAYDALEDLKALGHVANGRRVVARTNLRSQAVRAAQFVIWAAPVAVVVLDLMPPGEARSSLVVWCLLAGMGSAATNSTLDRFAKRRLLREYTAPRPTDPAPDPPDNGNGAAVPDAA